MQVHKRQPPCSTRPCTPRPTSSPAQELSRSALRALPRVSTSRLTHISAHLHVGALARAAPTGGARGAVDAQADRRRRVRVPDAARRGRRRGVVRWRLTHRVLRADGQPVGPVDRRRSGRARRRAAQGRRGCVRGCDDGGLPRRARPGHPRAVGHALQADRARRGPAHRRRVRPDLHGAEVGLDPLGLGRRPDADRSLRRAPGRAGLSPEVRRALGDPDEGRCGWLSAGPDARHGRRRVRSLGLPRRRPEPAHACRRREQGPGTRRCVAVGGRPDVACRGRDGLRAVRRVACRRGVAATGCDVVVASPRGASQPGLRGRRRRRGPAGGVLRSVGADPLRGAAVGRGVR